MKKFSAILVAILLVLAGWSAFTYPKIGQVTLSAVTGIESTLYGLDKKEVQLDGLHMVYYESKKRGDQPTLLLLHGYSADKNVWIRFSRYMTDKYHVVIPDLAGHGETGYDPSLNYSADSQSKYLIQLLDSMNIKRAFVAGNSMGGLIAAYFAWKYPQRTKAAILVDPAGVKSPKPSEMQKMLEAGKNPFLIHNRQEFREFYAMTMANPPFLPNFVLDAMAAKYETRRDGLKKIREDFSVTHLDDKLGEIKVPVLLLWGREDNLIDVSATEVWKKGILNIRVKVYDGIGHMPMVEDPKQTASDVDEFINLDCGTPREGGLCARNASGS